MKLPRILLTLLTVLMALGSITSAVCKAPRASIITSVYNGDEFIKGFLEDITQQTLFDACELILVNPNSPGHEEPIIHEYLERYPNIMYIKLKHDPGLYGVWNMAIGIASGDFITNANIDDRRNPESIALQIHALEQHPEIDLVYGDYYTTRVPNQTFNNNTYCYAVQPGDFSAQTMYLCLPGPMPMWRKSMHTKYGYFRSDFIASGDFEFWNRAASLGAVFKKIPGWHGLFYLNQEGLSHTADSTRARKRAQEDDFIARAYKRQWYPNTTAPKLLIKMPTCGRPERFFATLDAYYQKMSGTVPYEFVVTCDTDDLTMNCAWVRQKLKTYPYLTCYFGNHEHKIEAYNADLHNHTFDILVATADDKEPLADAYDAVIVAAMQEHFPDTDGVLHFNDGYAGAACNTMPIMGKKFYDRLGYIYNPAYKALCANQELMLVAKILGRSWYSPQVLIKHNHPVWGIGSWDKIYFKSELSKAEDQAVFNERRKRLFDLDQALISAAEPKELSILICTLDEREASFKKIYNKLLNQINQLGAQDRVEILTFKDNREHTIGYKRNCLLAQSRGTYVCAVDDDDDVHDDYIRLLLDALKNGPDCVKLVGRITTRGANPQSFVHSIAYNHRYGQVDNTFYRAPNHLNPIKRRLAVQIMFPEINRAEDYAWGNQLVDAGLLVTEAVASTHEEPLYFYRYDGKYDTPLTQYYCTAANSNYFALLCNLIGSIHKTNFDALGQIAVYDIGLTPDQRAQLNRMAKVQVYDVEQIHDQLLAPFKVNTWGKTVPGYYAWKPVVFKQALDLFEYVLWIDAGSTVLRSLDPLFKHIKHTGYFLGTIGNEQDNGVFRNPLKWCTTQYLIEKFNLKDPENAAILDNECIMGNLFGATHASSHLFADKLYELAHDIRNFHDDGSTGGGFGSGRHDQTLISILGYLHKLTVHKQDYTQANPIMLTVAQDQYEPFYITWHPDYVTKNTHLYSSRGDARGYDAYVRST